MRPRLLFACLLVSLTALLGAAAAASGGSNGQGDGTLAVHGGRGSFTLQLQGSVIGRIDKGKVTIEDPDTNGTGPIVRGKYWVRVRSNTTVTYGGTAIRFRILGGRSTVRIENSVGVELSVVGRGKAMLKGAGFEELGLSDGEYSLNGAALLPVPQAPTWLALKAPAKPGGPRP